MQQYLLTQDVGVFSCKGSLFTLEGETVRTSIRLYDPQYDDKRWAWQDPELWWTAFAENCRILLQDIPSEAVIAVCLCGQMMGCLPVDRSGHALADSIIWEDVRSQPQVERLIGRVGADRLHEITGLRCSTGFSLSKIMWLAEHHPDLYDKTAAFLSSKDYINCKLTGVLATDPTDAGFTQAYDLMHDCWSQELLDHAGLDRAKFPQVLPMGTVLGPVTAQAAQQCGLSTRTQVVMGAGDGRCVVLGSGVLEPGDGCIYLGSSSWVSQVTQRTDLDPARRLTKACYYRPKLYTNGGTMLAGRLSADWFVREFFSESFTRAMQQGQDTYRFLDEQLGRSPAGSNGLLFLPYLMGERSPWWNTSARGGFLGLRSTHNKYDFCRSVVEGVCFHLGVIKNSIEQLDDFAPVMRMVGGGANSRQWQQVMADVMDHPVLCTNVTGDVGCVGAALIAGVGIGVYPDWHEIARFHRTKHMAHPIEANVAVYRELLPAFVDCYYALKDINQYLSRL